MPERRKQKRRHLYDYFDVYNRDTGALLGKLADINLQGARIVCPQISGAEYLKPDTLLKLGITVPKELKAKDILLDAICVWSNKQAPDDAYITGLQIINITQDDFNLIKKIFL